LLPAFGSLVIGCCVTHLYVKFVVQLFTSSSYPSPLTEGRCCISFPTLYQPHELKFSTATVGNSNSNQDFQKAGNVLGWPSPRGEGRDEASFISYNFPHILKLPFIILTSFLSPYLFPFFNKINESKRNNQSNNKNEYKHNVYFPLQISPEIGNSHSSLPVL